MVVEKFGVLGKLYKKDTVSLHQRINRIPLLDFWYLGSSTSDYVPTLDNDTFANKNTQPSNMQGEQWIMIANDGHKLSFANSLERPSFFKQQYKQMMLEPLQYHPSFCCFSEFMQFFMSSNFDKKNYWSSRCYCTFTQE